MPSAEDYNQGEKMRLFRSIFRRSWESKSRFWHPKNPHLTEARKTTILSLDKMFDRARADKLWFFCRFQKLWLSPSQLKEQMKLGNYIWGPSNWVLRDPTKYGLTA